MAINVTQSSGTYAGQVLTSETPYEDAQNAEKYGDGKSFSEKTFAQVNNDPLSTTGERIWKFLTTADGWFNTNLYESIHDKKDILLGELNFLPHYVQTHVANDLYTKMFTQLYPDPPTTVIETGKKSGILDKVTGAISNAAGSVVTKIGNTVANQITSTVNYAKNLVSTLTFGLVGTSSSAATPGKNISVDIIRNSIPHLKVTEIRLNDKLTQKGILFGCLKKMWNSGEDLGAAVGSGKSTMKDVGKKIANGFEKGLDAVCEKTIGLSAKDWISKMASGNGFDALSTRIGGLAYAFIRNGASGQYMNTYELPKFGPQSQNMLKSMGSSGFKGPPPMNNPVLSMINSMTGGNGIITENITWDAGDAKPTMKQANFTGTFYLFNDNLNMYTKNLDFILRFVTHAMPIRDSFMYRAPCCYDVTDVGNRRCYFCSGSFEVKKVGKIRRLSKSPSAKSNAKSVIKKIKEHMVIKDAVTLVNDDVIDMVPDAFEITYTFEPLITETYNTFIYYFLEQGGNPVEAVTKDTVKMTYGSDVDFLSDKLMKTFTDAFVKELG